MPHRMNVAKKLKQTFVLDKIKNTDWLVGTTSPLIVELDTTEVCDLSCPGCISADLIENSNSFSNERLMKLAEEFVENGIKGVILIGGGEPLAHPKVGDFMQYLGKRDIHIGITTNGTMIDRYLDIIAEYSSWTRVSMDAATSDMFQNLRPNKNGKSKFEKVVQNMRDLAKIKKGTLGYSFLIRTEADGFGIQSNIHEIYPAAELARDIGCDYFEVKPSYSFIGGIDHALVKHSKKRMEEAKIEVKRIGKLETDKFKIAKAINLKYSLDGADEIQPKDYKLCPATELRTLICPSGVFVCPYWRGKERYRIGNLNSMSFVEMWKSERRKSIKDFLDPRIHCTFHCLRHESNIEVMKMIRMINNKEEIIVEKEYDRFI